MIVIPILVGIIVIQFVIIMFIIKRQKDSPTPESPLVALKDDTVILDWLNSVMRDPNPFTELIRFAEVARSGQADALEGAEIIQFWLRELYSRGKLRPVVQYNKIVSFDPKVHRSSHQLNAGESVIITDPGWRFGDVIFKYPIVVPS